MTLHGFFVGAEWYEYIILYFVAFLVGGRVLVKVYPGEKK